MAEYADELGVYSFFERCTTMQKLGPICLAIWLILMGAMQAFDIKFNNRDKIMGILAIIAGVVFLVSALSY